jgi:hypothetical protein
MFEINYSSNFRAMFVNEQPSLPFMRAVPYPHKDTFHDVVISLSAPYSPHSEANNRGYAAEMFF